MLPYQEWLVSWPAGIVNCLIPDRPDSTFRHERPLYPPYITKE